MVFMKWPGVVQKTSSYRCLTSGRRTVKVVERYVHTFFVLKDGKANERDSLYYTAIADTPEQAEQEAYVVYLRASGCQHKLRRINPMMVACQCGLQKRLTVVEERIKKEEEAHQMRIAKEEEKKQRKQLRKQKQQGAQVSLMQRLLPQ